MTPEQFKTWRKGLGLTQQGAADALGLSKDGVRLYETGVRRDTGAPVEIPKYIELACCEVSRRVHAGEQV